MVGDIMKVITICGSMKYKEEIMMVAQDKALEGFCVLTPTYLVSKKIDMTDEQITKLKEEHFKRIEISDAILVINKNNYIGDSTKLEIEYARGLGKEVIYYSDLIN